jgi:hypothetical protein
MQSRRIDEYIILNYYLHFTGNMIYYYKTLMKLNTRISMSIITPAVAKRAAAARHFIFNGAGS